MGRSYTDLFASSTPSGSSTYAYGDSAHKHTVTSLSTGESYSYDANGNMTCCVEGGITYKQVYNIENLLTTVHKMNGTCASGTILETTQFVYDGGAEARYYPFGESRFSTASMLTDKLFTGQREMTDLGIYHYNARFYSPYINRFLRADTIVPNPTNPQTLNRYSYVTNNPLRYTDPTGQRNIKVSVFLKIR
jgi:RHS repeat-associated protein